jgi:hypothetical protein
MRDLLVFSALVALACSGSTDDVATPPPRKPDPYVSVRVRQQMDTTTAPGRAHWHLYVLLTGPYSSLNGIGNEGAFLLGDVRLEHTVRCIKVSADSVGQRFMSPIAFADTTTEQGTPDATADAIVNDWYNGNHNLPAGWMAIFVPPTDAWQSAQYVAGHGLTPEDPIRWDWTWSGAAATNFVERTDSDPACSTF